MTEILKALLEPNTITAFLLFVLPGFVAFKFDQHLRPQAVRSAFDSLIEIVVYSLINDLLWSPLYGFSLQQPVPRSWREWLVRVAVLIISPAILTLAYARVVDWLAARGIMPSPVAKPWDHVFQRVIKQVGTRQMGVIITLRDDRRIAGVFKPPAFASSFPADEQIYLAEVWVVDADGGFGQRVAGSLGLLIDADDILLLEFFEWPQMAVGEQT